MKIKNLIARLSKLDPESEVFTECPETGYSWTINMVISVKDKVIILIEDPKGPVVPDFYDIFEVKHED